METDDLVQVPIEVYRRPERADVDRIDDHVVNHLGYEVTGLLDLDEVREARTCVGSVIGRVGEPGEALVEELHQRGTGDGQEPILDHLGIDHHDLALTTKSQESS